MENKPSLSILFAVLVLLCTFGILSFAGYYFYQHKSELIFAESVAPAQPEVLLADDSTPKNTAVNFANIPGWLFVHVAVIAGLQVLSVLAAAFKAQRRNISNRDLAVIQFLIEIPMYLGLFGTLMGVSLTQFISGTLVAPLAYLTTMSGILLHVFGKLTIWLALADESPDVD